MRLLLAHASPFERRRIAGLLAAAGHEVVEASTPGRAAAVLAAGEVDVAVIDWLLAARMLPGRHDASSRVYLILVHAHWTPPEIEAAFAAGAHDLIRLPVCREELLGRVDGMRRMQRWAHASPLRARDFTTAFDLTQLQTWRDLDAIVAGELAELVGLPLRPAGTAPGAVVRASEIPLVLASERVEVRLGLGVDELGARCLARAVLGAALDAALDDAITDAIDDALRELANTAGGALKRAALAEGVVFTMGLPTNASLFAVRAAGARTWAARDEAGLAISCIVQIAAAAPARVTAGELLEGMVIARDVHARDGALVAAEGTHLTQASAARIVELIGPDATLEVTDSTRRAARAADALPPAGAFIDLF